MTDRPLWQLLLDWKTATASQQQPFSCAECFTILEYLAEALDQETAVDRQKQLFSMIRQHLAVCPDCQKHFRARLEQMEQTYRLINKR